MTDYVSLADLEGEFDPEIIDQLARSTYLVALSGEPCWESERLQDFLAELLKGGAA